MSNLLEYKCPACGGGINFDTESQQMKCPFCETSFEVDALKVYDDELKNEKSSEMEWNTEESNGWREGEQDGMSVYSCKSCGGEIVGDDSLAATKCPYCDNPIVMTGQFSGDLRPDYAIPFKLDKKAAKAALQSHFKGKRLLPKVFKDENHIDEVKGIYVPFWLFDADVDASIRYKGTKTRSWSDSRYNYVETSHFSLSREGNVGFERVPVDGSTKMADDLMESIEPYDFKAAVDFQTAYLAGYLADKYDVSSDDSITRANQRIKKSTEDAFLRSTAGYHGVIPEHSSVNLTDGKVKYALLPVWLLNTSWNGAKYTFAMNGLTGKMVGDLPLDKGAYWRMFGIITAITTAVAFGFQWLFMLR